MTQTNKDSKKSSSTLMFFAVAIISVLIGLWASQQLLKKPVRIPDNLQATLLDKAKPLKNFSLIDHNNQVFNLSSVKGKWSFMFFGYTHCPDVCPLAMQVMKNVWNNPELKKLTENNLKMIFVSVDPDRDTPELLKSYVQYYHPKFIGVTGKAEQIDNITGQLGILYGFDDPNENGDYNVSHSGQIILIDPQGNMRGVFSPPLNPQSIAKDFLAIKKFIEER